MGFETSDDAGVYRLDGERALVNTADFITPPVDDGEIFGKVAAANSLSDIYAMGGRPLTCLNLVAFPSDKLPEEILHDIIRGAAIKIAEAGAQLVGGHTIMDEEPKFGLAVTGIVHPERIWRNVGARPGDILLMTKKLGSGVLFNANLKGKVSQSAMQACLEQASELNRVPCEVLQDFPVHACTDITGFGLAGHAMEMSNQGEVCLRIHAGRVPVLAEAREMYEAGVSTGSNGPNRLLVQSWWKVEDSVDRIDRELLVDPLTSGGLLVALPEGAAEEAEKALREADVPVSRIGQVLAGDGKKRLEIVRG